MTISQRDLQDAAAKTSGRVIARSLSDAFSKNIKTAFLSHSHKDKILAQGLQTLLVENGWDVYIDWQDERMPAEPTKETAKRIKNKIIVLDWFLFLATQNSTNSRWCPWEIGYADSKKDNANIVIIPTRDDSYKWHGSEYLQLYRSIAAASNENIKKSGYAVFEPGQTEGGKWISNL